MHIMHLVHRKNVRKIRAANPPQVFAPLALTPQFFTERSNPMNPTTPIPKAVRVFIWILLAAGLFFAYVYTFNPALGFPGTQLSSYSEKFAFASTGIRVLGSVVGLAIALYLNSAPLMALMLATRIVIELGDVVIALTIGGSVSNIVSLSALAAVEIGALNRLMSEINRSQR